MILLVQNRQEFNNDIRAMIMAFFPGIKIVEKDDGQEFFFEFHAEYETDKSRFYIVCRQLEGEIGESTVEGDYRCRDSFRNNLKLCIYRLLCRYTKRVLPWGDLTGVRPTKIAMKQIKDGVAYEDVVSNYMNLYDVSLDKATLATRVAQKELSLVSGIDFDDDYCLYVGIPFCPSRCLYCSFTSYDINVYRDKTARYIEKLCDELNYIAGAYRDKKLVAVYIGGGTPTSISHELLDILLSKIESEFDLSHLKEFTVEAGRPDSITREKLQVMKKHFVSRISINPQTMNDDTLKTIGRAHNSRQAKEAFYMAREEGFDNINMDLIAGLPGENLDSMRYTLEQVKSLVPESITVHSLAIKRAANLRQQMDSFGAVINQDMEGMHALAAEAAEVLGMEPYYMYRQKNIGGNLENVGYAKQGFECLYNILIMEEMTDIIAAGAGSSTKLVFRAENRVERVENCKSVDDYIERFEEMLARKGKWNII